MQLYHTFPENKNNSKLVVQQNRKQQESEIQSNHPIIFFEFTVKITYSCEVVTGNRQLTTDN